MNREIKFRAWDKFCGGFAKNTIDVNYTRNGIISFDGGDRYVLMQYTGLKDKNGKEIYEGDIVECTSEIYTEFGRKPTGRYDTTIYQILWSDCRWRKKVISSSNLSVVGSVSDVMDTISEYGVVIGDIYQNPELLEGAKRWK